MYKDDFHRDTEKLRERTLRNKIILLTLDSLISNTI